MQDIIDFAPALVSLALCLSETSLLETINPFIRVLNSLKGIHFFL
jgi:hypothetical protein